MEIAPAATSTYRKGSTRSANLHLYKVRPLFCRWPPLRCSRSCRAEATECAGYWTLLRLTLETRIFETIERLMLDECSAR